MGGDHGPTEVVPGVLDYARAHPDVELILVGDTDTVRGDRRRRCPPTSASSTPARSSAWTSTRRRRSARRRTRRSSSPRELVRDGEADAVVTAGHTGAGMAAGILKLGRLPGVDRPGLAVQMITDAGPMVLIDIGANPDSTPENLAQYARMGAIFAERVLGVDDAARRAAEHRRGEGQGRRPDPARDRAARRVDAALRRQRRGQRPDQAPRRRRRDRRGRGQRRDQVLRGPLDASSSTCGGPSSGGRGAAGSPTC